MLTQSELALLWYNSLGDQGMYFRPYLHNYLVLLNIDFTRAVAGKTYLLNAHPTLRYQFWRQMNAEFEEVFDFEVFKNYYEEVHQKRIDEHRVVAGDSMHSKNTIWYLPNYYDRKLIEGRSILAVEQKAELSLLPYVFMRSE